MLKPLENLYEFAPLPMRLGLAALFAFTGIQKILDPAGTAGYLASLGFPAATAVTWLLVVIEIVGAAFLLLGLWTRLTAIVLTILLAVAITTAYIIPWDPGKLMILMFHWPALAGTISLMLSGPGRWSLDEKFFLE